ncbi:MAG: TonB-dependent receptor [Flavobacteriaceae bacterium CG_4_10_14_3_um_filter_33_47]|nr:MAG: TonB-dependent receptor [Flavobacteriaceae bacterium CG_4_10_14_3_um_filter_33_47]PJB19588.1 MAG: TonB-dependent receptor [Flavobacteriaceae bacterium CG_4_9_14_3_um_filter_33_16]
MIFFDKKNALVIIFLFYLAVSYSQIIVKGNIVDNEHNAPISAVQILNLQTNSIKTSNALGEFEINEIGTYKFTKKGYQEKEITIQNSKYLIVQLQLNPLELNEIIVSANHIPQRLKTSVATIDIITPKAIEGSNSINFNTVLNQVPGVFMQTGSLNTNKISIRGIGSRNLFGTSKIRAYFQDIPLTTGNGESTIEDFELGSIARLEIIKGAASSIYGAGLGGTIHLIPQNAYLNQTSFESGLTIGSFGLSKNIFNVNYGHKKNSFRAVYSNTHSHGYRENNDYNRQTFTFNSNHYINKKNHLTFLSSLVDLKSFIPSSINEEYYINYPKSAAFTWKQSKGYEDSQRGIFGISWNHQFNSHIKQITSIFTSFKNAYEPRPFDILKEQTVALGARSRILGTHTLFNKTIQWTFGAEGFKDSYTYGTFQNLYQDFPEGTGSVQGNPLSDFKEKRTYYNLFFETNYSVTEKTTLSLGANYNKTSYILKDLFVSTNNPDQSGSYTFSAMLSPKLGISHGFSNNVTVYANISHGFSPPTTAETLLPDGLINTQIKPESGWNYEIGTRTSFINNRLQFNLAIYRLDVRNLLVARRTSNNQFIGVNAGKTQHDGLEMSINYQWLTSKTFELHQFLNYAHNHFVFKEFIDNTNDFSGNKLTGVPPNVFNTGINMSSKLGIYSYISFQHVGKIPMTDSNSLFSKNYNLTNVKLGYETFILKKMTLSLFFGLDNVFNEKYASQILINATGFGGSAPRYYYPGNPINYYSGIHLNYLF